MTSIVPELQSLSPSAIIELFQLELRTDLHGSNDIYYFHSGANARIGQGDVVWAGNTYTRMPIEADGFEYNGKQLPRPKIRVANLFSTISAVLLDINATSAGNDLIGAKVTRIRTCARYLDAINFENNQNPYGSPDPTAEAPREIYFVDRKTTENRDVVEFELAASIDLANVVLPGRQCISSVCQWVYRSAECGYTSTVSFDENDNPVNLVAATDFAAGSSTLSVGGTLEQNEFLVSPNGWYKVIMQPDGNLVVYSKAAKVIWNTLTGSKGPSLFAYQEDGNLVIYDAFSRPTWASHTQGRAEIDSVSFVNYIPADYFTGDKDDFVWVAADDFSAGTFQVTNSGSGYYLYAGDELTSDSLWYRLVMQPDGNLVVYNKTPYPVWATDTGGQPSYAWFQPDGNLVVYRLSDGAPIWSSGTALQPTSSTPATNLPIGTGELLAGSTASSRISSGDSIYSSNGWYRLTMQADGNLVLFDKSGKTIWQTATAGSGATYAQFQSDGNFVLYDNLGGIKWSSNTGAYAVNAGKRIVLQPDGNLVIYGIGGPTSTTTVPAPNFSTPGTGLIYPGSTTASRISRNQSIYSSNGWYRLTMQSDGNLVITNKAGVVTWNSGTYGTAAYFAQFQADSNLVLYDITGTTAIWWTNHGQYAQNTGYVWKLDDSGEFVLFDRNYVPLWRSWTGTTVEPTVSVTNQSSDVPLWSTSTGKTTEPSNPAYPSATLVMGDLGELVIVSGGVTLFSSGYSSDSEPGRKEETGDNRAHAFLWEVFGSADDQAGTTQTVQYQFVFGTRTMTIEYEATANLTLPVDHYSGQSKSWSLNSETFISSQGRWYLDEIVDAIIETDAANPFREHPSGTITGIGRQYTITGTLSTTGTLQIQNDGNFVLKDSGGNAVWDIGYSVVEEPKVPGPGESPEDVCGKRLSSCKARFGDTAALPFGSFPGVGQYFG